MRQLLKSLLLLLLVSACSRTQSQSQYNFDEVGQPITIEYAEVFNVRPVEITGHSSGAATAAPNPLAATGGATAYVGNEIGSIWGTGVGAAEQAAADKKGYEYTVVTESHATKTIVQYQNPDDVVFKPGDLVMLQNSGTFHRLLSTDSLPEKIKNPHRIKIEDEPAPPPPPPVVKPPEKTDPPPATAPKAEEKKEERKEGVDAANNSPAGVKKENADK